MMKRSIKSLEGIALIICMMLAVILPASCAKEETNREAKYTQPVPAEYLEASEQPGTVSFLPVREFVKIQ